MANLIIPSVYSQLTRDSFLGKVKVMNLAKNLGILKNTQVGDTVHFPVWSTIGEANEVVKGTESKIEELNQKDSEAKIKMYDSIVRIYDFDSNTALGDHIGEASQQQAIQLARKVDLALINECLTSPLKSATSGAKTVTADEINSALLLFSDEQDSSDFTRGGIVINSLLLPSFYAMAEFVDRNKTYNTTENGKINNGLVGFFRGYIPVYVADHGTYDKAKNECLTIILKNDAVAYIEKTEIDTVEERMEKLHCSDVVSSYTVACKLIKDDGCVVLRKTIA